MTGGGRPVAWGQSWRSGSEPRAEKPGGGSAAWTAHRSALTRNLLSHRTFRIKSVYDSFVRLSVSPVWVSFPLHVPKRFLTHIETESSELNGVMIHMHLGGITAGKFISAFKKHLVSTCLFQAMWWGWGHGRKQSTHGPSVQNVLLAFWQARRTFKTNYTFIHSL